jgi:hypothetical protein
MSDPHRECWDLLPWFVTDRVSKDEAKRLEQHLSDCAECRAELDSQRLLRDAMRSEDALVLAPQAAFQKLMQRIDDDVHAVAAQPAESMAQAAVAPTRRGSGTTRWLAIAACVQGVAITGLLGALVWQSTPKIEDRTGPDFQTRSQPDSFPQGVALRTVFADNVTVEQMNELLHSINARVVDGPSKVSDVYTLTLVDVHDAQAASDVAQKLKSDPRIRFIDDIPSAEGK